MQGGAGAYFGGLDLGRGLWLGGHRDWSEGMNYRSISGRARGRVGLEVG